MLITNRNVKAWGGDSHMEWTGMLVGNFEFKVARRGLVISVFGILLQLHQ